MINKRDSYYRDRIRNGEPVQNIVDYFVHGAIDELYVNDAKTAEQADSIFVEKFRKLNRMARSISIVSHGYENGYILHENWFAIIFARFAIVGAERTGDLDRVTEILERRFKRLNLDLKEILSLECNEYEMLKPVKHIVEGADPVEYYMKLTAPRDSLGYIDEYSRGSILEGQRGAIYTVRRREPNGIVVVWSGDTPKDIRLTNDQVRRTKKLVDGYLLKDI